MLTAHRHRPVVTHTMSNQDYEGVISEASLCHNPDDALKRLHWCVEGNSKCFHPGLLRQPESRDHQKLLAGIFLRAGYVEQASRVLAEGSTMDRLDSMDAFIVDPGFVHLDGHHYNSNVYFKRLVEKSRLSVSVLRLFRQHPSFAHDDTNSLQTFVLSPYEKNFFANLSHHEELRLLNKLFLYEFQRVLPPQGARLFIAHTARHTFIEGLCRHLQTCVHQGPRSVLLGIVEADATEPDHPMHAAVREIYRRSFRILQSLPDLKLMVMVETPEVANFLRAVAGPGLEIVILPYVAGYLDEVNIARKQSRGDLPIVGYVGQSRPERGTLLIPEIAKKTLLASPTPFEWRVQLDLDVIRRNVADTLDHTLDWLETHPKFECMETHLSLGHYYDLLATIDIMVMPYSNRYNGTGSGIAIESLKFGHVQVVPEGSSMTRVATAYQAGIVTFPEATVDHVTRSIIEALKRFDELHKSCVQAAQTARDESGPLLQVERFIRAA